MLLVFVEDKSFGIVHPETSVRPLDASELLNYWNDRIVVCLNRQTHEHLMRYGESLSVRPNLKRCVLAKTFFHLVGMEYVEPLPTTASAIDRAMLETYTKIRGLQLPGPYTTSMVITETRIDTAILDSAVSTAQASTAMQYMTPKPNKIEEIVSFLDERADMFVSIDTIMTRFGNGTADQIRCADTIKNKLPRRHIITYGPPPKPRLFIMPQFLFTRLDDPGDLAESNLRLAKLFGFNHTKALIELPKIKSIIFDTIENLNSSHHHYVYIESLLDPSEDNDHMINDILNTIYSEFASSFNLYQL